jgi:hypothetical protein
MGQLLGSVHGDLVGLVGDRRIAKPLKQLMAVLAEFDGLERGEGGGRRGEIALDQPRQRGPGHRVAHISAARQVTRIGDQRMGAVEHAQLHAFIRLHILDE